MSKIDKIEAINWNNVNELDNIIWKQNNRNIWFPEEISISDDKLSWKSMNKIEQDTYKKVLGGLTLLDTQQSLVGMPKIMLECNDLYQKSIMTFMGMMEAVHAKSYSSIFTTLCTTEEINDIFDWVNTNIYLIEKMRIILDIYNNINKYSISTAMAVSVMLESFLFYSGFFYPLYLAGNGKLTSSNEIINLIIRDECLEESTELLTPTGWKCVKDITMNDEIAQYNYDDNTIQFVKPVKISSHKNDIAYHIKNYQGHVEQLVSPEHRVIIESNKNKLNIIKAKDILNKHFNYGNNFINTGIKFGGTIDKLSAKDKLLIAIQADGSFDRTKRLDGSYIRDGSRSGFIPVGFGLSKQRKIDRLYEIVNELDLKIVERSSKGSIRSIIVYIPKDYPIDKLLSSITKLDVITANYCKEFIEEISYWDGYRCKSKMGIDGADRLYYSSCIKENTDFVQAVASLAGYKTLISHTIDNRKQSYKDGYRIFIHKNSSKTSSQRVNINKLNGNFKFYGIEVESGLLLTKRNGSVVVTGNSIHGVYIGNVFKMQDNINEKFINDTFKKLYEIELLYTEYLYKELNLVNEVQKFIRYNANKAFMNLGLDIPFPDLKDSDINSLVLKGLNTETKTHNFFDSKGNGYIKPLNVEKVNDDDFNF